MKDDIFDNEQPLLPSLGKHNQREFDKKSAILKDTFFFYYIEVR